MPNAPFYYCKQSNEQGISWFLILLYSSGDTVSGDTVSAPHTLLISAHMWVMCGFEMIIRPHSVHI